MIGSNALQTPLGPSSAFISLGMTIVTLANPLVTVYFVKPYREGLKSLLRLNRRVQPNISTTAMMAGLDRATRIDVMRCPIG